MSAELSEIYRLIMFYHDSLAHYAEAATLIFLRVGAVMATLPGFGEQSVPPRIRLVLAIMLSAAIAPMVLPAIGTVKLVSAFLPEVLIGLTLGLMVRMFILTLMTAGSIIGNAISLAQLFPAGGEAHPTITRMLIVAGLALAMEADFHLHVISYLLFSYELFAVGVWPESGAISEWGVANVSYGFALAFQLSMPFVIGSLLYNVALGVINRAMPQLMVSFIGAPALALGGLIVLALSLPMILAVWLHALSSFLVAPLAFR